MFLCLSPVRWPAALRESAASRTLASRRVNAINAIIISIAASSRFQPIAGGRPSAWSPSAASRPAPPPQGTRPPPSARASPTPPHLTCASQPLLWPVFVVSFTLCARFAVLSNERREAGAAVGTRAQAGSSKLLAAGSRRAQELQQARRRHLAQSCTLQRQTANRQQRSSYYEGRRTGPRRLVWSFYGGICSCTKHRGGSTEEITLLEFNEGEEGDQQEIPQAIAPKEEEQTLEELLECPDHCPTSFLKDGTIYHGYCKSCFYPAMDEE
ncbi:uncharacterized protein [Miscanthus floridulus]|uniref:uncharacterized protein n=1 Tax=Miscanthus floridulus TaxID=154761 RepID=UPI00345AB9F6